MNNSHILLILTLSILFPIYLLGEEKDIVGSERCKICHKEEYEAFSKTSHKDTSKSLNTEQKNNKECLMCHSMDKEGKYMEIGCEACHGGGKYYSQEYVMKDKELSRLIGLKKPDEKSCENCHNQDTPKIKKMDIKEGMKKIEHKRNPKTQINKDGN
ncbi:MAG: cytochrome c family protein [Deltaproteobacteria bacterium]|nr:cytochrome c family protein [Deltaproteobacteria bacterium]